MSQMLANKYRPKSIKSMIGQNDALAGLALRIKQNKIPNVLLVSGASGSGKTSLSRIIAYTINDIKYGQPLDDFNEVNLGVDRGIDDMRAVIETANYMPMANYRVILLDEIAKATSAAVSALLKPLEDVPPKTIWILATDTPNKLPATLIRRCFHVQLQPVSDDLMQSRLKYIAKKEKCKLHSKIASVIVQKSRGQLGLAMPLLQYAIDGIAAKTETKAIIRKIKLDSTGENIPENIDVAAYLIAMIYNQQDDMVNKAIRKASGISAISLLHAMQYVNAWVLQQSCDGSSFQYIPAHLKNLTQVKKPPNKARLYFIGEEINKLLMNLQSFNLPEFATLTIGLGKIAAPAKI